MENRPNSPENQWNGTPIVQILVALDVRIEIKCDTLKFFIFALNIYHFDTRCGNKTFFFKQSVINLRIKKIYITLSACTPIMIVTFMTRSKLDHWIHIRLI
jgi:hypothetical protein